MPSIRQNLEQLMRKSKLSKNLLDENTTPAYLDIDRGTCKNLSELHAMGADLNKVADLAAEIGKIKYLKILKTLGVDFEIANTFGTTPAYIAADKGHIEVIKLFKKWGVQLDKSGHVGGKSLIHAAVFRGHTTLLKLFHSWGLKMDIPDEEGRPPIFMALINGNMEVLELFKDLGIKLDTPDRDGNTIIHLAAQRASLVALKFFHIWGMKLDTPNNNYQSPAHLATDHNNLNVLIWFQSWGVNLDISLPNDTTLMYIAASCGHLEIVKFLIQHHPHQAKIPARFTVENLVEFIRRHSKDEEIRSRVLDKVGRQIQGDPDSEIKLLPIDIAEIRGYSEVMAELEKLARKERLDPISNSSPRFLKPAEKRPGKKEEKNDNSPTSTLFSRIKENNSSTKKAALKAGLSLS